MGAQLAARLQPIADWFAQFNLPEPIVHWGHPAMMGIVIFVLGTYTAWAGWQGRTAEAVETKQKARADHKKLAPFLFLFITLGYTGGILSLVMQGHPILESSHFWTGSAAIAVLALNGFLSATKFLGGKPAARTAHAYIGSAAMVLLVAHAALGLKLGLAL
jgi:magnesium-transporting ATPase (P-type)